MRTYVPINPYTPERPAADVVSSGRDTRTPSTWCLNTIHFFALFLGVRSLWSRPCSIVFVAMSFLGSLRAAPGSGLTKPCLGGSLGAGHVFLVSFIRSPILSPQGRVTWKWTPVSTLFICRFHRWTDSGPPRAWPCCDLVTEMTSYGEPACSRPKKALGKPWKRLFPVPPPHDKVVKHLLGLLCSSLRKT